MLASLGSLFALALAGAPSVSTTAPSPAPSVTTIAPAAPTATRFATPPRRVVPGDLIIKLPELDEPLLRRAEAGDRRARGLVEVRVRALAQRAGISARFVRPLPAGWALLHDGALDEDATEAAVLRIEKLPGVAGASTNRWYRALRTPNDEFLSFQWDVDAISAKGAWDVTQGLTTQRVGVIDSGTFLAHEDLGGKDQDGFDFVDNASFSGDGDGRDADYDDPGDGNCQGDGSPDSFHGSHVAGTILANSNNGLGVAGVNWNAKLITGRALAQCGGASADIIEALAWMIGLTVSGVPALPTADRPTVVNMSLGTTGGCSSFDEDILSRALGRGVLPVVAAGNDGGPVNTPANCPSAIAVAAFGPSGDLASYSSFGPEIDIVGPGGDQDATGQDSDGVLSFYSNALDPPYIFYQGTSMAAPHVAGVISLMQVFDPTLTRADVLRIFGETGASSCGGCGGKPALRADLAVIEASGGAVVTDPGDACVADRCSAGQNCVSSVCRTACGVDGDCLAGEICGSGSCVTDPGGGGGGGGGATCDPRRGNMDCEGGFGCVDGTCVEGEDDGGNIGTLCDRDTDCATGLCEKGVCTVTCDDDGGDCRDGFECDDDAVPGGLCVPESCKDEDADFCESGWSCHFSPTDNYVCAFGESNYGCSHGGASPRGAWELVALLGLAPLWRRRRR